jgi:hypothetical protein
MLRQKNISASAPDSTSCVHHQHYPLSYPVNYPVNHRRGGPVSYPLCSYGGMGAHAAPSTGADLHLRLTIR